GAGVAAIALIVWPFIAPKLKGNFDRVAMCGALAIHLSLTAWGFGQDAKKGVGYFRTPDLEAVMTEMGKVNERLGYEGQLGASERAAEAAADLLMLLREVEQLADHGDVKDRKRWLEWCAESRERVIEFWSKPRDADATLHSLRTLCDDCHKLQETDENVWPILPHPPDRYPLSEDAFANLAPTSDIPAKLKNLMKHMHQAYDELNAAGPGSAQALLDLEAYTKALAPYFESEGMADVGKREVWDQTIRDLMDACRMIRQAEAAPQVYEGLQTAHIACGACHTEFGVDDDAAELAPPRK
ncbi:MAG: hypothetical protein L6Q71_11680, partial [Planctomycetes bacterium]|nr:hypothetical protein [Planctomycetota bacterium]